MKKTALFLMAASVFAAGTLLAQGPDFRRGGGRGMRNGNMEDFRTKMSESWAKAQAELRKKAPEKYAEIEKLQSTNLLEAMNKMRELAAEQGIELHGNRMRGGMMDARRGFDGGNRGPRGDMMRGRRGNERAVIEAKLKKEYPEDYAKIEQARQNVEEQLQALAKKANVKLPDTLETARLKMNQLKAKFPKEFEEIEKLRKEDPRAAEEKIRELAKKAGIELPAFNRPREERNGQDNRRGGNPVARLYRKYPEKMKELEKLRRTSPAEYRQKVRELLDADQNAQQ